MPVISIFGHQHPDTDSVCSAIALAKLKNELNIPARPCILSAINPETERVLSYFHVPTPQIFSDGRLTLSEIDLDPPVSVSKDATVRDALSILEEGHLHALGVVDQERLCGILTIQDISRLGLSDTAFAIDLIRQTPVENIARVLDGTLLVSTENTHLNGKISMVAMCENGADKYDVKDRIVILGSDEKAQKNLIQKGAGMLILVWTDQISQDVRALAEEHDCPIILSGHGGMNTSRYIYYAAPVRLLMSYPVVCFEESLFLDECSRKMRQTRYRTYPVLSEQGRFVGFVQRLHILNAAKKQVILVDHNSFAQSAPHLEEAEILEVVDHHRISDFSTPGPITFRNERCGATASIVARMYEEHYRTPDPVTAGLLLSAIISDTLYFHSPTCTQRDIQISQMLGEIAGIRPDQIARLLFSQELSNKSAQDLLQFDLKEFLIGGEHYLVSQISAFSIQEFEERLNEFKAVLDDFSIKTGKHVVLCLTGIEENGSLFLFSDLARAARQAFGPEQGQFQAVISRKLQIIPALLSAAQDLS